MKGSEFALRALARIQADYEEQERPERGFESWEQWTNDVFSLMARHQWSMHDAMAFLTTREVPSLVPAHATPTDGVCGPYTGCIVVVCSMHATTKEVADAYQDAALRVREQVDGKQHERIRPISKERTSDLAVFGARVQRGEFASLKEAYRVYQDEHPRDGQVGHRGRWLRDMKNAYHRITGLHLTWGGDGRCKE